MANEVVIVDGVRSAIGAFGGSLANTPPADLAAAVVREALKRADVAPEKVAHLVLGHVINTEARDQYLSRVVAIEAGLPVETAAMNVNRLCGSGAQAIVSAAQHLMLGDADYAVAGGCEVMSRGPHSTQSFRRGVKMGEPSFADMMVGALTDPFGAGHMGVTAENVAAAIGLSREDQDAFAVESQRRAAAAIADGRFKGQITPIEVKIKRKTAQFDTDEYVRAGTSLESLAGLRPVFKKDGTVTAANASGINDGAAAVVLARASAAERDGLKPRARLLGYAHAGVKPEVMGFGPIPAVKALAEKTGLSPHSYDVVESNEAFAAQACAVTQGLDLDPAKVNPNGGAIALGHPIGATGAILVVKAMAELERVGGAHALVTMCIGGGQGIALALERL